MGKGFYDKMGASATKDEVHAAIKKEDKGLYPNAFCKMIQDPFDEDSALIVHSDGVGTKSLISYLMYKETGDPSYFRNPPIDSMVMNLDDMACVGAIDNLVMANTIDRNAARIGGDAIKQIITGYRDTVAMLKSHGVSIISGGGETADVGDLVATTTINSTFFTRVKKDRVITFDKVKPGDVIVGLASFGKATYEDKENSGIGSNGFTAARHSLLSNTYAKKYPEIVCTTLKDSGYQGKFLLTDKLPGSTMTIGEALISPTRTYVPVLKEMLDKHFNQIHGIIHNTGGGLTKSRKFGKGLTFVKDNLFEPPAIFNAIYETGKMDMKEMFKVFNMGQRMEIYTPSESAQAIIDIAKKYNIDAKIIGRVEKGAGDKNTVVVKFKGEQYEY